MLMRPRLPLHNGRFEGAGPAQPIGSTLYRKLVVYSEGARP